MDYPTDLPTSLVDGALRRIQDRIDSAKFEDAQLRASWYRDDMTTLIAAMRHYYDYGMEHLSQECQLCPIIRGLIGAEPVDIEKATGPDGAILIDKIHLLHADIHLHHMNQAKELGWTNIEIGDEEGRLTLGVIEALHGRRFVMEHDDKGKLWIYIRADDGDTYRMEVCRIEASPTRKLRGGK